MRTLRPTVVVLLLMALLAGCGQTPDASSDPRAAVTDALKRMGSWDGVTATISVDSTTASLMAAFGEDGLEERHARILLDSSFTVRMRPGEDPADSFGGEGAFALNVAGSEVVSMLQLGEDVYLRVDVDRLLAIFDRDGTGAAELEAMMAEAEAHGFGFAKDVRAGSWIRLTGLKQIQSMAEGMFGVPSQPSAAELEAVAPDLRAAIEEFLDSDVDFAYVGSDAHGEQVRITTTGSALIDLGERLVAVAGDLWPSAPGMTPAELFAEIRREVGADAATFVFPLDLWVSNGVITRVAFDVVALADANPDKVGDEIPAGVERLGVAFDLADFRDRIEAPADAVHVDLFELFGRMMGGMFSFPDA